MRAHSFWLLCGAFLLVFGGLSRPITSVQAQAATGTVAGIVLDRATGKPVYGIFLRLEVRQNGEVTRQYSPYSYVSGEYRFKDVRPGEDYRLFYYDGYRGRYILGYYDEADSFETATPITIAAGQNLIVKPIYVDRAATLEVNIDVGDETNTLTTIQAVDLETNEVGQQTPSPDVVGSAQQIIRGVPSGRYALMYSIRKPTGSPDLTTGYYNRASTLSQADAISVTSDMTTTVDLDLTRTSEITGAAYDATTGKPISSLRVFAYDADGIIRATAYTANGVYRMRYLMPGTYTIEFTGLLYGSGCAKGCPDLEPYETQPYPVRIVVGEDQTISGIDRFMLPTGQQYDTHAYLPLIAR